MFQYKVSYAPDITQFIPVDSSGCREKSVQTGQGAGWKHLCYELHSNITSEHREHSDRHLLTCSEKVWVWALEILMHGVCMLRGQYRTGCVMKTFWFLLPGNVLF